MTKLSDLLESGWFGTKQVRGRFQLRNYTDDLVIGTCAVGAICLAKNPLARVDSMVEAYQIVPELETPKAYKDTDGNTVIGTIGSMLVEMNDYLSFPKEAIVAELQQEGL